MRLAMACSAALNNDEALHYLISARPSMALAYQASLREGHPPLLYALLHYWVVLGHSELAIRLPSVLAGTAFCWVLFLWLDRAVNRSSALIGLAIALFSRELIYRSAEVRQYALLLLFCAGSLYFLERAIGEKSSRIMLLSGAALNLALLTHYSSFIFALSLGIYALLRFRSSGTRFGVVAAWAVCQACALALIAFLIKSQIFMLETQGLVREWLETYLRAFIFHPGTDRIVPFVANAFFRFFYFLFGRGAIAALGLALFIVGVILLLRDPLSPGDDKPRARDLGLFLLLPFVINAGTALAGVYPFGGTRQNSVLALFAIPAISIAFDRWKTSVSCLKPALLAATLVFCGLPVTPLGAQGNQWLGLTRRAMDAMHHSIPNDAVIFTDFQSALMLSYYFCSSQFVPSPSGARGELICGGNRIIYSRLWAFSAENFMAQARTAQRMFQSNPHTPIWLFQSDFITPELRAEFGQLGCPAKEDFGDQILFFPMKPR
jgi:hypothetical protein